MNTAALVLTDPIYRARPLNALERVVTRVIRDPRDLPFLWLLIAMSLTVVPAAAFLIADPMFTWWMAVGYLVLVNACFSLTFLVIIHFISHRPLFKREYAFLKHYVDWVIGPLFGMYPNAFYAHHVAMHHAENNLRPDLSSTRYYQRDSLLDFLRYAGTFVCTVFGGLAVYLWRRKRYRLLRAVLIGEASYFAAIAAVAWFNWKAALVVFIVPLATTFVTLMCVNWSEHAFIDRASPHSIYGNTAVCLNTLINRLGFNAGYHIGHHLKPGLHWSELPADFLEHRGLYARERAIVFAGLNFYAIFVLLMTKQYRVMARHCVNLGEEQRSEDETIEILRQRTALSEERPCHRASWPEIAG